MQEALADYAAARDSVLRATKRELGEVVRCVSINRVCST